MFRQIIRISVTALVLVACSCGSCDRFAKDMDSEFGGLERRVTLYSATGTVIQTWQGTIYCEETESDGFSFLLDGDRVILNGTYLVEELH